jgi:hypothetical protein
MIFGALQIPLIVRLFVDALSQLIPIRIFRIHAHGLAFSNGYFRFTAR